MHVIFALISLRISRYLSINRNVPCTVGIGRHDVALSDFTPAKGRFQCVYKNIFKFKPFTLFSKIVLVLKYMHGVFFFFFNIHNN